MSHQPKPQEWRYEEFHPSHYKVFIGNREIGFVSSEDEAQWITLEGNASLAAERERSAPLVDEIFKLRKQISEHRCGLPASINEALNSGDGVYRP